MVLSPNGTASTPDIADCWVAVVVELLLAWTHDLEDLMMVLMASVSASRAKPGDMDVLHLNLGNT